MSVSRIVNESQAPPIVSEGWREQSPAESDDTWRLRWGLIVPVGWATLGIVAALQQAASFAVQGRLQEQWVSVALQLPRYLLWALLTPLIVWAARRFPLTRPPRVRHMLLHQCFALLAVAFVEGIQTQFYFAAETLLHTPVPPNRPGIFALTIGAVFARMLSGMFTYFAVAVIVLVLDHKRRRETRDARLEADLAQAQVQAIKMQVQPHFLFNTLHAINVLIRRDPATAEQMVTRLGDLLRHTLSRATLTEVPLRSELEVLGLYLEIERVRFHDRLTIQFDVGSDTVGALVPDLLLQPLAENAIKHGLNGRESDGVLSIRSHRDGDDLVIEVSDNGDGPTRATSLREGVGLSTVRTRLARLYGDRQSFAIERRAAGGCTATVRLPFHEVSALA